MSMAGCLAVAQTIPVRGDVTTNLEQHLRLAGVARAAGAGLLIFPELSLTGYELDLAERLAFAPDDERLAPLVDAAASSSMILIAGAPVRLDGRLHIAAFIISPEGTIALYTKHHLGAFSDSARADGVVPPAEATFFQAGDRNPLIRLGDATVAMAVCADTGRPAHPRAAAERGAGIYLASMFVIPSDFERETANLGGYAVEHSMLVAFANYGGRSGGLASAGRSGIWSPDGEPIAQLGPTGGGIALALEDRGGWRGRAIPV
jgi:predicted amidohydrolase